MTYNEIINQINSLNSDLEEVTAELVSLASDGTSRHIMAMEDYKLDIEEEISSLVAKFFKV